MKPVRVLAAIRQDINHERDYYNRAQPSLGSKFTRAVAKTLCNIRLNPKAMQVISNGVRRWSVEHFSYGVMYSITDSEVLVASVFHPLQDPVRW